MVSLSRNLHSSGSLQGAVFFDASVNMDDEEYLQPVLISQEQEKLDFQKLDTIPFVSIPLILGIALEITGIIFMCMWPNEENKCNGYFVLLYLHCAYWLVILIVDYFVRMRHYYLRIGGYLDFYQSTYQHIRTPLFVASLWNTVYLLLAVILHQNHKGNFDMYCGVSQWFTPVNYILLFTSGELMIIVPVYVNYIKRVMRFNRTRPLPDVIREEWLRSFTQDSYTGEVGFHQRGLSLQELLEKQADLIRYLRDHNVKLSHKMMLMASQHRAMQP